MMDWEDTEIQKLAMQTHVILDKKSFEAVKDVLKKARIRALLDARSAVADVHEGFEKAIDRLMVS